MATSFTPTNIVPPAFIPGSLAKMYTVPQKSSVEITQMVINNTDSVNPHTVTIYLASNSTLA